MDRTPGYEPGDVSSSLAFGSIGPYSSTVEQLSCKQKTPGQHGVWAHKYMKKRGKRKSELDLLPKEEFFRLISEKCNYVNVDLIKQVYYEMIRLTGQQLRHHGAIRYPDLGDFYIKYRSEKRHRDINTREIIVTPPQKVIKFTPDHKLSKYFASLS